MKKGIQRELQASFLNYYILATQEWLINLIIDETDNTQNAFLITLGHELTHQDEEVSKKNISNEDKKFVNWVIEVYCDFGAAKKMVEYSRERLIKSMEYKINMKHSSIEDENHPSWNNRLKYATNYNFDKKLIKQIYTDSGCKNEKLLNKAIEFYKNRSIELK